jgi:SAM-dependent methyltransferase
VDLIELPAHLDRRHPWEEARFEFFFRVLAGNIHLDASRSVLDVGAGDAWFAEQLASRSAVRRIVCSDAGYTPDFLAARRHLQSARIELSPERPADQFDLLMFLDVLEHIEDDECFLRLLVRENLVPGGHVLISVPAWSWLFSSHDVRLRHHRRYRPASARALLQRAGLEIICSAGLFHSLLLPRAIQVTRERLSGASKPAADIGEWNAGRAVTLIIRGALRCEGWLSLLESKVGYSLPGVSWWALCQKGRTCP